MKKWVLFLVLISIVQVSYSINPALAQTKEESAIKQVIENHIKGIANEDLDLVMQQISTNYSAINRLRKKDYEKTDYNKFRSRMAEGFKKVDNASISDVKITNINVQGVKATLVEEYNIKGYRVDTAKSLNVRVRTKVYLVKEGNSWKIVQLEPIPIVESQ